MYGRREKRGRETGYPRGRESGEIGNEFCNIAQYFAIEKSTQMREPLGKEVGIQGTGSRKYRPPPLKILTVNFLSSVKPYPSFNKAAMNVASKQRYGEDVDSLEQADNNNNKNIKSALELG